MIVVLWRAGLHIQDALALAEADLDHRRGAVLVQRGARGQRVSAQERVELLQLACWLERSDDIGGDPVRRRAGLGRSLNAWQQVVRRLERISRLSGRVHAWLEWGPCAAWPVRGQDNYRGPWNAKTPNPILLVNQRYDPNSDYANAVRAERLLGNAVLLTHEGYGHLSFQNPSACVDQAMARYLTS